MATLQSSQTDTKIEKKIFSLKEKKFQKTKAKKKKKSGYFNSRQENGHQKIYVIQKGIRMKKHTANRILPEKTKEKKIVQCSLSSRVERTRYARRQETGYFFFFFLRRPMGIIKAVRFRGGGEEESEIERERGGKAREK